MTRRISSIEDLVGEQVSSIHFALGGVEFHFDGPIVRAVSNPIVEDPSERLQFPLPGSRDAICAAVGRTVRAVEIKPDLSARFSLDGGYVIEIPLGNSDGQEAMHFLAATNGPLAVWD